MAEVPLLLAYLLGHRLPHQNNYSSGSRHALFPVDIAPDHSCIRGLFPRDIHEQPPLECVYRVMVGVVHVRLQDDPG